VLAGFETFTPKLRTRVGARWRTTPLFGGYFFVRVVDRWRILERTIGVLSVVKFGAAPAQCPDQEIAKLIALSL
jgi:transcription antitermination factor NusG